MSTEETDQTAEVHVAQYEWQRKLVDLVEVVSALAFKPDLKEKLQTFTKTSEESPTELGSIVSVVQTVAKQNKRVAELYGYASLEMHSDRVDSACQALIDTLGSVPPPNPSV